VCGSVWQCVAVCGSAWQCVAVCGSAWQCVAVQYIRVTDVSQRPARMHPRTRTCKYNRLLQIVAACCSVMQCFAVCEAVCDAVCEAVCCNELQCVAVCCSVLQCVAVCCSVLQWSSESHHPFSVLQCVLQFVLQRVLQWNTSEISHPQIDDIDRWINSAKHTNTHAHTLTHAQTLEHVRKS